MSGSFHDTACGTRFAFAELRGADEAALAQAGGDLTARARALLAAVLAGAWRGDAPVALSDLTLCEFDAALAALYSQLYQSEVPCQAACTSCAEPFEFQLDLKAFQTQLWSESAAFDGAIWEAITAPSGRVFRLPRLGDLPRLAHADPEDWLQGFLEEGAFDSAGLQEEMAQAAPILSQDLETVCPECSAKNTVRFDMARYLVDTIEGEAAFLWREVHLLARGYHWSLPDILGLSRVVRRQLAGLLVASERPRVRAAS